MILAEELMFIAAKKIGKKDAHEKIHQVTSKAWENNSTFDCQGFGYQIDPSFAGAIDSCSFVP